MSRDASAFPLPNGAFDDDRSGMALRDYFAAATLAQISTLYSMNADPQTIAARAYVIADAMLSERIK